MDLEQKIEEFLEVIKFKYSSAATQVVDDAVATIKEVINGIPEDSEVTGDLAPGFLRDVGVKDVRFRFSKPKVVELCGSYLTRCLLRPNANVDLMVRLPKACFVKGDHLDYRYFAKRCLYLCMIRKYLLLSPEVQKVEWSTFHNEARKPVLVIYPAERHFENCCFNIRIIPTGKSVFKLSKLKLHRSNLTSLHGEGIASASTPYYNSSILEDMFLEENVEFIYGTFRGWRELQDALILMKAWAQQRCSVYSHDCLNGFLISVLLAFLATEAVSNRVNRSMTPTQIFRIAMSFIATSKAWDHGLYFQLLGQKNISDEEKKIILDQSFPVVLCNPFAHFNFTFRMSKNGFLELREEAGLALICIDKCPKDGFEKIFMSKIDFCAKYDYCTRLNLKGNSKFSALGYCLDQECWRLFEQKVHCTMKKGLSDRAKLMRVLWRNIPSEFDTANGFLGFDAESLLIGMSINSLDKAFRMVDVGPSAEDKEEALQFRTFWGDKAELRRFKDGKISESTVWDVKQNERHLIMKKITEHILSLHHSLTQDNIIHVVDQLDFSLHHSAEVSDPVSFSGSLIKAFEVLCKHLRLLEDIPLRVSSVQPLSSAFRFTSVFPPGPHPLIYKDVNVQRSQKLNLMCIQPLEVMIQLEGSGSWPTDEIAVDKTKFAFLLKIGESLQSRWGMTCVASEDNVDILVRGYAFRLKIFHEKGLSLLKKQGGNIRGSWLSCKDKQLFYRSQHASMINGLHGRFPTFGPVVRLAKRWTASHLFSACFADEAIELLVAHIFLNSLPFQTPSSRICGFLRFLRLLSAYKWDTNALVIDINNDFSVTDEEVINEHFMQSRKISSEADPSVGPAMFLATPYDKASEAWTRVSPTISELRRLVAYACSSANLLTKLILQGPSHSHKWESLFRTPLNNFDAIILLHRNRVAFPHHLLFPNEVKQGRHVACGAASEDFRPVLILSDHNVDRDELISRLMVDFDPLRSYLEDLEKDFPNNVFKLWYDSLGADVVGLTWHKSSKKRGRDDSELESEDPVRILRAVADAGKGLVKSVYLLKPPRHA